ncbi:hypothetical protein BH11MYX1_BH11MYX1_24580 [soil metagenome]
MIYHHVAITGAACAIGSAIARAMRAAWPSCELALIDRDAAPLDALAVKLGGPTEVHVADLRDLEALPALVDNIGALDGLVNCAGVMKVRQVSTWQWSDAHDLMKIDLLAPLRLQDLICRGMVEQRRGVIVNIASMAGRVPLRGGAYYGA